MVWLKALGTEGNFKLVDKRASLAAKFCVGDGLSQGGAVPAGGLSEKGLRNVGLSLVRIISKHIIVKRFLGSNKRGEGFKKTIFLARISLHSLEISSQD